MNIERIDPRLMKAILQLQLSPAFDSQSGSNALSAGDGSASLFDTLLSQYMNGASGDNDKSAMNAANALTQLALYRTPESGFSGLASAMNFSASGHYASLIQAASAKYGVDSGLIQSVIEVESSFRPDAVSSAGAKGLMQLMDGTARGLGVTNSFDPEQNINGGTRYLSLLLNKYEGNVGVALAAYNAGPGRIDSLGIKTDEQLQANMESLPKETQRYITKVLSAT